MKTKKYSVVILLNNDGTKVLLQTKDHTAFAGMLNGVGGKIEDDEKEYTGALREIEEETSLKLKDLKRFEWLGTLIIPEQCDIDNQDKIPELYFYGGIVKDENLPHKPEKETEEIKWYRINNHNEPVSDSGVPLGTSCAGNGDLQYFIRAARRKLFNIK